MLIFILKFNVLYYFLERVCRFVQLFELVGGQALRDYRIYAASVNKGKRA